MAYVLTVTGRSPLSEAVGDALRSAGTTGIWEVSALEWRAFFPAVLLDLPAALAALSPPVGASWKEEDPVDWAARYQASLRPLAVGRRFTILPSEEIANPWPSRTPIGLVPGAAFGTGEHYTTASCLRVLERLEGIGGGLLDVGCGSGILASAAWMLGFRPVAACDVDPEACRVAGETAILNDTPFRVFVGSAGGTDAAFGTVVANILAETLVDLMPDLAARVAPGGRLLLSGIMVERGEAVLGAAASEGLVPEERRTDGEWWTLVFRSDHRRDTRT